VGWEIVEETLYRAQCNRIEPDARRLDEILEGLYWGLGQDPRQGFPIPNTRLWLLKTDAFPNAPRLRIWYSFDTVKVYLRAIEVIGDEE
jgi:hypothetical protein